MSRDIRQLAVFRNLQESQALLLAPLIEPFFCEAGQIILQQGSPADFIYIMTKGRTEIAYKPYDGDPITVTHVEAGGVFGWSAVTGSLKYTSSVIAVEHTEGFRMHGNQLRKVCKDHPEAGREILNCLANAVGSRWKGAHEQVKAILAQGMK